MNEHIEYFKRYAECYLEWSHINFDHIVKDTANEYLKEHLEERKYIRNKPMRDFAEMMKQSNRYLLDQMANSIMKDFDLLTAANAKIGDTLQIRLPNDYRP